MELLQLKYFCDAAKSENFSKTAKNFGVPPSDISQSVRRLERELGVSLFIRQANKITLNDKGTEFYRRISEGLTLIDEAKNAATDDIKKGRINICINSNRRIVMETVEKFKAIYPEVEIRTTNFSDPKSEDFDIVIDAEDAEIEGYEKRRLISEGISLAVVSDSKFAKLSSVDVGELKNESFITMTEKSSLLSLTRKICADFDFEPHITIQSDDPFYVRKCVELGLGIAIVPSFSWKGQFPENVVLKPIDSYVRDTYLYTKSRKYLNLSARSFVKMLIEECDF